MPARSGDPFAALKPLLSALARSPLPPVLLVTGDDDWILAEAVKRCASTFLGAFAEGEISTYAAPGARVKDAVDDAATVALFATNRLVGPCLMRVRGVRCSCAAAR